MRTKSIISIIIISILINLSFSFSKLWTRFSRNNIFSISEKHNFKINRLIILRIDILLPDFIAKNMNLQLRW